MFIDETSSLPTEAQPSTSLPPTSSRKPWLLVGGSLLILLVAGVGWWYWQRQTSPAPSDSPTENSPVVLPPNSLNEDGELSNGNSSDFKAESLAFGTYYKSLSEPFTVTIPQVKLPLNVKSQVSNYYEVARKLSLDSAVNNLNQNGFAVISSPFPKSSDNFFATYQELDQREIPLLLTSDFMLYYYENSLKRIYRDIESSYFYDNLWNINKKLFETANGQYQDRQRKLGTTTDRLLEAQRLEAGYFATALALLAPQEGQIMTEKDNESSGKFSLNEAGKYQFSVPSYLSDDVNRELALIRSAKTEEKSPVLLYQRNYKDFVVPDEYTGAAKLRNVYLAEEWQTTVFPLHYQGGDCQGCLLDQDDWVINQIAAYLISEHITANQNLKNDWAKIYKVISYFSGLRSGLTYLHYQAARQQVFGTKTAEEIFVDHPKDSLQSLQAELQRVEFKPFEGAYRFTNQAERPLMGMRLLQTRFWPETYIYDRLTDGAVGAHTAQNATNRFLTSCNNDKLKTVYRCRGFSFDLVGTITEETPTSSFYQDNIQYQGYAAERAKIRSEFEGFVKGEWYSNRFWSALSLLKSLWADHLGRLPYKQSAAWKNRQATLSTSALTALALPRDEWQINRISSEGNLETASSAQSFHYSEPSSNLLDELVAHATMLSGGLSALGVIPENDVSFRDLTDRLSTMRDIVRQELRGEQLSSAQQQFITDVVRQYTVTRSGQRSRTVTFYDPVSNSTKSLQQTIGPLQLLVLVYEQAGQRLLAVGPVLSYSEK